MTWMTYTTAVRGESMLIAKAYFRDSHTVLRWAGSFEWQALLLHIKLDFRKRKFIGLPWIIPVLFWWVWNVLFCDPYTPELDAACLYLSIDLNINECANYRHSLADRLTDYAGCIWQLITLHQHYNGMRWFFISIISLSHAFITMSAP